MAERKGNKKGEQPRSDFSSEMQTGFNKWMATEAPKAHVLEHAIYTNAKRWRDAEIDENEFVRVSLEQTEESGCFIRTVDPETDYPTVLEVDRTGDNKLRVTAQQVGSIPRTIVTAGLANDGTLAIENVDAEYIDEDTGRRTQVGKIISTDMTGVAFSKRQYGKELFAQLKYAEPFEK